jgi:hypothetical protein
MIFAASIALTKDALYEWKHLCRHKNVPQTWKDFKMHFRDAYIPAYCVDHLLTTLEKLKQGSRTMKQYYHDFKICIMFGHLDECMEDVMSKFMRGLNSEIQTCLINESYSHISHLFLLAHKAEKEEIVEPAADLPFSQCNLLAEPCDKEELCDSSYLTSRPQLELQHSLFPPLSITFCRRMGTIPLSALSNLSNYTRYQSAKRMTVQHQPHRSRVSEAPLSVLRSLHVSMIMLHFYLQYN